MKKFLIISVFSFLLYSCDSIVCGELSGEWKLQFEKAATATTNLKLENIPCEFYYINVIANSNKIDTNTIHSLHKLLYNQKNKIGWQVLLVYNAEGKYLFSHRYNNSIYIQTGD